MVFVSWLSFLCSWFWELGYESWTGLVMLFEWVVDKRLYHGDFPRLKLWEIFPCCYWAYCSGLYWSHVQFMLSWCWALIESMLAPRLCLVPLALLRSGWLRGLQYTPRLVEQGLLHGGPPCGTFVFINRATSKRSSVDADGDPCVRSVGIANTWLDPISLKVIDLHFDTHSGLHGMTTFHRANVLVALLRSYSIHRTEDYDSFCTIDASGNSSLLLCCGRATSFLCHAWLLSDGTPSVFTGWIGTMGFSTLATWYGLHSLFFMLHCFEMIQACNVNKTRTPWKPVAHVILLANDSVRRPNAPSWMSTWGSLTAKPSMCFGVVSYSQWEPTKWITFNHILYLILAVV